MFSRLTRIALLALALCVLAPGAFACASQMASRGDCCPPDHPAPCDTQRRAPLIETSACCTAAVSASAVAATSEQVKWEATSPAPLTDSASELAARAVQHAVLRLEPAATPLRLDTSQTYLQTRRLRL